MGEVVRFPHQAASTDGLATASGQGTPSGHRSENQRITSSYLRAVKVLSASSSRSKKRQSPAAKRPIVAKLTARAAAYAEAHAMRLDRSSDSITADHSRKIPTLQAPVGKFRLASVARKSDKSAAMSSLEEVRSRIRHAMERAGDKPVSLAAEWDLERNHLRDFLERKKDSLKPEVLALLADRYDMPLAQLIITRPRRKRKAA